MLDVVVVPVVLQQREEVPIEEDVHQTVSATTSGY